MRGLRQTTGQAFSEINHFNDLIEALEKEARIKAPETPVEEKPVEAVETKEAAPAEEKPYDTEAWKDGQFQINRDVGGPEKVKGIVNGAYGIHKVKGKGKLSQWTLTHLPTGRRVSSEDSEVEAQVLADVLSKQVPELNTLTDIKSKEAGPILQKALDIKKDLKDPFKGLRKEKPGATIPTEKADEPTQASEGTPGVKGPGSLGPDGLLQIAGDQSQGVPGNEEVGQPGGSPEPGGEEPGKPLREPEPSLPKEGPEPVSGAPGRGETSSGHIPPVPRDRNLAHQPGNFRITADTELEPSGKVARFDSNVKAIKTLKAIEAEGRLATPEEQSILAKYVGWGQLKNAFETYYGGVRVGPEKHSERPLHLP